MNVNEITFGCELECMIPAQLIINGTVQVGGYHAGRQISALPRGWNGQSDASIRAEMGFSPLKSSRPF